MGAFNCSTRAFDGIMYIIVVALGSYFMMKREISPADLTAYLLYASTLLASIRRIVEFTEQFQRGMTGIDRFSRSWTLSLTLPTRKMPWSLQT